MAGRDGGADRLSSETVGLHGMGKGTRHRVLPSRLHQ
jgi:hypothetical protein